VGVFPSPGLETTDERHTTGSHSREHWTSLCLF